jgi:predicted small metal-binding protein
MPYAYRCKDFPGMEKCPASFTAESEPELWKHIELHAREAHQEDPAKWSADDRKGVKAIIRRT